MPGGLSLPPSPACSTPLFLPGPQRPLRQETTAEPMEERWSPFAWRSSLGPVLHCLCGVHEAADCAQMQRPGLGLEVGADEERQRDHLRLVVSGPHFTLGLSCRVSRKGGVGASVLNVTHVSSCLLDCSLS